MLRLRRVVGDSMAPTLRSGSLVLSIRRRRGCKLGDIVIIRHDGLEKMKRITQVRRRDGQNEVFVEGDNALASTDSRQFGWLSAAAVQSKVIWPRLRDE